MTELSVSLNFPLRVMIITLLAPTYMEMSDENETLSGLFGV